MDYLSKVFSRHNEWIRIVNSFGYCPSAECIVQDMYIELTEPTTEKGIEDRRVNPNYIGMSNEERVIGKDGNINIAYICIMLRRCYARNYRETNPDLTTNIGEGFEFRDELIENDSRQDAMQIYQDNMEKEIATWNNYDSLLFRLYKEDDMSLRKIEKETGICYMSIYRTIENCKRRLIENCREDYRDLQNGDFELIRLR